MNEMAKGARVRLGDGSPTALVTVVTWDPGPVTADLFAFVCTSTGRALSEQHFLYYNSKVTPDRAVFLLEDTVEGVIRGSQVMLDVTALPPEAELIDMVLVATRKGETLQPVTHIRLELWDPADGRTLTSFVLDEGGLCNGLVVARLYQDEGQWMLWATGERYPKDFASLVREYGIAVN